MDPPNDFRSTVLQAPSRRDGEEDRERDRDRERERGRGDRDRRHLHDISSLVSPQAPPPPRHAGFSLRSPTQSDFQHPQAHSHAHSSSAYSSPHHQQPSHHHDHRSPPSSSRSHQPVLSHPTPFSSSSGPGGPLAPTLPALGGASSSPSSGAHLQGPPLSPLHPPSGAYYPPPESQSQSQSSQKTSTLRDAKPTTSSYYDPLTDTTRERRISDAVAPRYPASSVQASPPKV